MIAYAALALLVVADERSECQRLAPKYGVAPEGVDAVQWDMSRVDLLNDEYAIEVDWSEHWAEAIGQSQWYAIVTGRKPAVLLLVRDRQAEARHLFRATAVCAKLGVRLYIELLPPQAPPAAEQNSEHDAAQDQNPRFHFATLRGFVSALAAENLNNDRGR